MGGDGQRMIFRAEAVRRHAQGEDNATLLQLAPPRRVNLLWCVVGLLVAGGLAFWLVPFVGRFFGE